MICSVQTSLSFTEDLSSKSHGDQFSRARAHNELIAERRITELLTSRFTFFEMFLQVAKETAGQGADIAQFRGHWLYLQILPTLVLEDDPFDALTKILRGANLEFLNAKAGEIRRSIRGNFQISDPLPIVIDEAQVLASSFPKAFFSHDQVDTYRPLLRQLLITSRAILGKLSCQEPGCQSLTSTISPGALF